MRRLLLSLAFLAAFIMPASAEEFTRAQIEGIIHDYIQNNPKVMIDAVESYGRQQATADDEKAAAIITKNQDWLIKNPDHAEAGNPKGDVTIVEFFDYNCGYCKQALGDVLTLLEEDKNLRLVFVEIPILGDSSLMAARWALAAKQQNQKVYLPFHVALMHHKGPLTESALSDYATKAGLNVDKIKADLGNSKIKEIIDGNIMMAQTLTIQGTPAFVIGDQLIRGYVGKDGLKEAVAKVRAAK